MKPQPIDYTDNNRPLELSDLTAEDYNFFLKNIYNGVGTSTNLGWFLGWLTDPADFCFGPAAIVHDFSYWKCGGIKDKLKADWIYFIDSLKLTFQQKVYTIPFYLFVTLVYTFFLFLFGWISFEWGTPSTTFEEIKALWEFRQQRRKSKKTFSYIGK